MKQGRNKSRGGVRLLVVDAIEPMRHVLAGLLQRAGYEVETAASADEVLQLTQLVRWDGVVLDADLPGMNGVELYARILLAQGRSRLPAVFLSGRPQQALQLGLHGAHWVKLLPKPCGLRELLGSLEQCLRANGETAIAAADQNASEPPRRP